MHDKEKDKLNKEIDEGQKTVRKQIDIVRKSKSQVENDTPKKLHEKEADLTLTSKENKELKMALLELRRRLALLEDSGDRSLGSRQVKHQREKRLLVEECKERSCRRQRQSSLLPAAGGTGGNSGDDWTPADVNVRDRGYVRSSKTIMLLGGGPKVIS